MNIKKRRCVQCLFSLLTCTVISSVAFAESPSVKISGDVKAQATYLSNDDLGTGSSDPRDSEALEAKVKVGGKVTDKVSFLLEARGVKNYGEGGTIDSDTGEATSRKDFLELRQYWVDYSDLFGVAPLSVRLGRQRFQEQRSLWWNRDLDALRVAYDATLMKAFIAVGQNLADYRTSDDSFDESDEDILRVLGQSSYQWKPDQYLEGRILFQNDYSGLEDIGSLIPENDTDDTDSRLVWAGIRLKGDPSSFGMDDKKSLLNYRLDVLAVGGKDDQQTLGAGPAGFRTVTGTDDKDVFGWAVDAGVEIPLPIISDPVLLLGYAYGSGDDDNSDGRDHAFRQTGLDGNTSRAGISSGSLYNYGSVLRPDLSNIHIATVGVTVPLFTASDISTVYHYYRLDDEATSLATSGIDAPLNGQDNDLGHALDIVLNVNVSKELNFQQDPIKGVSFKTIVGGFRSGEAYGDAKDETAFRGQMEMSVKF